MCRYACDLHPMLKVLAGSENIDKLLNIDVPVRFNRENISVFFVFLFKVDLSKLRYFYIDEMDAYFVNKVDREQRVAHRRVNLIKIKSIFKSIFI
jgi:hypothetical protein